MCREKKSFSFYCSDFVYGTAFSPICLFHGNFHFDYLSLNLSLSLTHSLPHPALRNVSIFCVCLNVCTVCTLQCTTTNLLSKQDFFFFCNRKRLLVWLLIPKRWINIWSVSIRAEKAKKNLCICIVEVFEQSEFLFHPFSICFYFSPQKHSYEHHSCMLFGRNMCILIDFL
jgi:hypothetical protein